LAAEAEREREREREATITAAAAKDAIFLALSAGTASASASAGGAGGASTKGMIRDTLKYGESKAQGSAKMVRTAPREPAEAPSSIGKKDGRKRGGGGDFTSHLSSVTVLLRPPTIAEQMQMDMKGEKIGLAVTAATATAGGTTEATTELPEIADLHLKVSYVLYSINMPVKVP